MLIPIISFIALRTQVQPPDFPSWASAYLQSSQAKRILAEAQLQPMPPKITHKQFLESLEPGKQASFRYGDLITEYKLKEAYEFVSDYVRENPIHRDTLRPDLIESSLFTGRLEVALRELICLYAGGPFAEPWYLLMLSYAIASRGDVFPGQLDYCVRMLQKFYSEHPGLESPLPAVPAKETAKAVAIESLLALGIHGSRDGTYYLELALNLDPTNRFAAVEAINLYTLIGRYSAVRRVANFEIAHLPKGDLRSRCEEELEKVKGKPDRAERKLFKGPIKP